MVKNKIEGFENLEDLKKFEDLLQEKNEVIYLVWKVSLNLALRISDVLAITEAMAIKFLKEGYYLAKDKKTNKANRVKLNTNTTLALERALELKLGHPNKENKYLFVSSSNRSISSLNSISSVQVFRVYKEIVDWLGLDIYIGTHSARKTWGLQFYTKTKDIALVMQRLNHSSQVTTMLYLGLTQKRIDKAIEDFNL